MEAAFVAPVFFLLIFGVIEFGFMFKDRLTVDNATRVGARAASVVGDDSESDFLILQSISHGLNTMNPDQIQQVIVYRATSPDDPVPASCLTGPQSGPTEFCNVYTPAAFNEEFYRVDGTQNDFFGCSAASADRYWCPTTRDATLAAPPPDYVGVYVETTHDFITGMFGNGLTLDRTAIVRLEPAG